MASRPVVMICLVLVALFAVSSRAEGENPWELRLAEKSPSVVMIRFVLKLQMQGQEREINGEVPGVLVGRDGLVLTSNSHFDPTANLPARMRGQAEIKATPVDINVLFGNEEEEHKAVIVARDSNLGLAFLQIRDLGDRDVKPVELRIGADPALGEELWGASRMSRGFDCAPVMGRLYINGKLEKPRRMWSFAGEHPGVGLPVFHLDGTPAGVISRQEPSEGVAGRPEARFVVLPLEDVVRSLTLAEERAAEALENAEPEPEDKPADEGTEDEGADDTDKPEDGE